MSQTVSLSNGVSLSRPDFLSEASGAVVIPMTNDYLFHALLQFDNEALRGLICSLLHLESTEVASVVITNPIELGSSIQNKDFILDIKILLNDSTVINLELQVINRHNWPERSLSYLCRTFDSLYPRESYEAAKTAMHIGLLDFTLFPEEPEFYATYKMLNVKSHKAYSDKLCLSVVDLTHTDLATEEDRLYHLDAWAALFHAATWEEIKMIAQKDENIAKAASTIWKLSQQDKIRLQCEAREDFYRNQRDMELYMESQAGEIARNNEEIARGKEEIARGKEEIARNKEEIARGKEEIARQARQLEEKDALIAALKAQLEQGKEK